MDKRDQDILNILNKLGNLVVKSSEKIGSSFIHHRDSYRWKPDVEDSKECGLSRWEWKEHWDKSETGYAWWVVGMKDVGCGCGCSTPKIHPDAEFIPNWYTRRQEMNKEKKEYLVISRGDDTPSVEWLGSSELKERINDDFYWGKYETLKEIVEIEKFPARSLFIVKGTLITKKPVEVVTQWKLESDE
jgi:hypothetical protein